MAEPPLVTPRFLALTAGVLLVAAGCNQKIDTAATASFSPPFFPRVIAVKSFRAR